MRFGIRSRRNPGFWRKGVGALALTVLGAASAPASATPTPADVTRATLDNGLRVVIVRDTLAPVVATELNYLVGSDEAPKGFPGTAHAVEHMMFRGSPGLDKDQLAMVAANMGGDFNADTTEGVTQYFFKVPVQDLNVALRIHAARMRGIDMAAREWASERGAIEQEVSRDISNPNFEFYTQLRARMFQGTPYDHTPLGTRDSFDRTTAAVLKTFHDGWYAPNNAVLVIAGDVDPQATLKEVRALFSGIPRKALPARPDFVLRPVEAKTISLPTDLSYGMALMAYRLPSLRDKDYATALVLAQALGSERAPLFEMGITGKALAGGFSADFLPQGGFGYAEGAFPRGGKPDGVLDTMRAIMAQAAARGVPAELVEAVKRNAIADLEYKKNSVEGLANDWSQAIAFAGAESPDDVKAAIAAVTPAGVNALARRLFDPAHAITAILTPQESGKPISTASFGGAESFSSKPDGPVTLPGWAKLHFAALPVAQTALHPTAFTLTNGIRLIVQPETVSKTVEVFGRIKINPDMQAPKGKEGVSAVLDGMFGFGTTHLDRLHFQASLDAISAHENAGAQFSLAVPSANFATGVRLLADNELNPAMPASAFGIVRQQEAAQAAGMVESPGFRNVLHLDQALLPPGDAALRHMTAETVSGLTLDDVKAFYAAAYRPDMTTIVVVGDIAPEQARAVFEKAFGGWHATGARPETDYPPVPLNMAALQFNTPQATAKQDSVAMSQQIAVNEKSPARYALNAGNLVLSGGFYSARLTRDLREDRGLVYTVQSGFDLHRYRGRFEVMFGSDPDKVGEAHDLILRDLKQMQAAPISFAELHQAKSMMLRQLSLGEGSFGEIGASLLAFSMEDKPLDSNLIAARRYRELTPAEIQEAFRQYIRPASFVTAVKGPAPTS